MNAIKYFVAITIGLFCSVGFAQILVEEGQGESVFQNDTRPVGEGAAREYFIKRKERSSSMGGRAPAASGGPRYMAIQVGTMLSDKQYRWGRRDRSEDVGELILGVTYRVGEWTNSMDLLIRAEYNSFSIDGETPRKLSFMPMITFPDARSEFPVYFGAGGGLGVFLDQVANESDLSFDYQVVVGARFMNIFETGGIVVETGLRGHVHLVSSGQFNGVFLSAGGAFTF